MSKRICKSGETWDTIAFELWSDEGLMHRLIAANPELAAIVMFDGGEAITIPDIDPEEEAASLPPWRKGE